MSNGSNDYAFLSHLKLTIANENIIRVSSEENNRISIEEEETKKNNYTNIGRSWGKKKKKKKKKGEHKLYKRYLVRLARTTLWCMVYSIAKAVRAPLEGILIARQYVCVSGNARGCDDEALFLPLLTLQNAHPR